MKNKSLIPLLLASSILASCVKTEEKTVNSGSTSSSGPLAMSSFAPRKDNASFPVTSLEFADFFNPTASARVVATLKDEQEGNETFTENHSVIPSPLDDSDGRYGFNLNDFQLAATGRTNSVPAKKHYLETIAKNGPIATRGEIVACGNVGTIEARIADCKSKNGLWAFYDGKKYGQDGEGDWKLVSVLDNSGKFEVWRDERTKLLWSDKASSDYNWFRAAGYVPSNNSVEQSVAETGYDAVSGSPMQFQPSSPISVCLDVNDEGAIAAGGVIGIPYDMTTETDFKAGLAYPQVTWRLPSRNDWYLAEVNGIRKVLPNMDNSFWSSSSYSNNRNYAWFFYGVNGNMGVSDRGNSDSVRCVASQRD